MKKKPQYQEPQYTWFYAEWRNRGQGEWVRIGPSDEDAYYHKYTSLFRNLRHGWFQEKKARIDAIQQGVKVPKRRGKYNILDPWEDYPSSRYKAKSWKDSHKCRKQWMKNL